MKKLAECSARWERYLGSRLSLALAEAVQSSRSRDLQPLPACSRQLLACEEEDIDPAGPVTSKRDLGSHQLLA
ncbi:hypothetical protein ACOSQ3_016980 [Xanthoceras sorbifolium]